MKNKKSINGFMMWILTNTKSFRILMYIGAIAGVILFGALTTLFIYLKTDIIVIIIMGAMFILSLVKLIKIIKNRKTMGESDFADMKLAEFMGYQVVDDDEEENKDGRQCSEEVCTEPCNADDEQPTGEKYENSPGRILESEEEPEFSDTRLSDYLQSDEKNS